MMAEKGGPLGFGVLGGKGSKRSPTSSACVRDLVHAAVWASKAHSQAWQASLVHPGLGSQATVLGEPFAKWKELHMAASINARDARTALERVASDCMPIMEQAVNWLTQAETLLRMLPQPTVEDMRTAASHLGAAEQHIMRMV